MAPTTTQSGRRGEAIAERHYISKGYKILARNYDVRGGEIDIVAFRRGVLVFVEVKSRSSDAFGRPCEAVDDRKIYHLRLAQRQFLYDNLRRGRIPVLSALTRREIYRRVRAMRWDIAEVYLTGGEINIIKDAFEAAEI